MNFITCSNDTIDKLFEDIKNKKFFWFAFQKKEFDLLTLFNKISNTNTHYFQVISSESETFEDPFLFKYKNRNYIFYEKVNKERIDKLSKEFIGEIYWTEIKYENGYFKYSTPSLALATPYHLSYPCIFEDNDVVYMIPEQCKSGKLILYRCDNFPDNWVEHCVIFNGNYIDPTIFKYNNYYWLFTTYKKKKEKTFKIFYTKSLSCNLWNEYKNKIITDNTHEYFRCGGNIIKEYDNLFIPLQIKNETYGNFLQIEKIISLTPEKIQFSHYYELTRNNHHFSCSDDFFVVDFNNHSQDLFFDSEYEYIKYFWAVNGDRRYQCNEIYPKIGDYLRTRNSKNVLDIGAMMYNIYNFSLFNNYDINYYQLDLDFEETYIRKQNNKLIKCSMLDIIKNNPNFENYFDVVVSHGVLGAVPINDTNLYLKNVYQILKNDGIFYLKLDNDFVRKSARTSYEIKIDDIYQLFENIEPPIDIKGKKMYYRYKCYCLKKKLNN